MASSPGTFSSAEQKTPPPAPVHDPEKTAEAPAARAPVAEPKANAPGAQPYARLGPRALRIRATIRAVILVLTLAGAALAIYWYAQSYELYPHTDNAYVQADLVRVAPRVSGPVVQSPLHDNQYVKQGELLLEIDPEDFQVQVDIQQAQLALSEAQLVQAKAAITQAESTVDENDERIREAQAPADRSKRDLDRAVALMNSAARAISQQDLDAARSTATSAAAGLNAAKAAARAARAATQSAQANLEAAQAQERRAAAGLNDARLQLSYTRIVAPVDGWVTNLNLPPGNYLTAGQSPLTLVADHTWRVLAYFKETNTGRIRPGQSAKVRLFPFPDKVFDGVVQGIGWGIYQEDGNASTTTNQLPNISPTVNWVRLPQRFPVRIDLPHEDAAHPFRIGQTAVVKIDTVNAP
ncbi:MAG TPA: HlyD family secretion protein [Chthoniobacter sp.]|jgi:multidrug resistance efflux pump